MAIVQLTTLPIRRLWKHGAVPPPAGSVHISMNDYIVYRLRDVPLVWYEAWRFRLAWPNTDGAVGLWIAALSPKRSVSISIWRDPEDLRNFVRSPRHLKIMKRHRHTGDLLTTAWLSPHFDKYEIWDQATERFTRRGVCDR